MKAFFLNTNPELIKTLDEINQRLYELKLLTESGSIVKWLTLFFAVIVPILVGFGVFYLNRNKEYRIKKSEICGMIYLCMSSMRIEISRGSVNSIYVAYNKRALELIDDEEFMHRNYPPDNDIDPNHYRNGFDLSNTKLNEHILQLVEVKKELSKHIGQYRFFINKKKRDKFDTLYKDLLKMRVLEYNFSSQNDFDEIADHLKDCRDKQSELLDSKYMPSLKAIEDFIIKN